MDWKRFQVVSNTLNPRISANIFLITFSMYLAVTLDLTTTFIISEKTSESLDRVLCKSQRIETSKRDINLSPMKINTCALYH